MLKYFRLSRNNKMENAVLCISGWKWMKNKEIR
jgi:hypothetical protein